MEGTENKDRAEIFSRTVRAGKRTYFFDVKETRSGDSYLTITESKKRFEQDGKFSYEKHKLFLYKEDFEKFSLGLSSVIEFIQTGKIPDDIELENDDINELSEFDVDFNELGSTDSNDK